MLAAGRQLEAAVGGGARLLAIYFAGAVLAITKSSSIGLIAE
jgi:hypothetical protein